MRLRMCTSIGRFFFFFGQLSPPLPSWYDSQHPLHYSEVRAADQPEKPLAAADDVRCGGGGGGHTHTHTNTHTHTPHETHTPHTHTATMLSKCTHKLCTAFLQVAMLTRGNTRLFDPSNFNLLQKMYNHHNCYTKFMFWALYSSSGQT